MRGLCNVWNGIHGQQLGFVGASSEYIIDSFNSSEHVPGGTRLLRHGQEAVGTVRVFRDDVAEESAEIAMLNVLPNYQ
jgi:hypothetical protein